MNDRRLLLGLAAFALVFLVASAAVLALVLAARPRGAAPAAPAAGRDEAALAREAAAHPFWRARVTEADVLRMARTIQEQKVDSVVRIDDRGVLEVVRPFSPLNADPFGPIKLPARRGGERAVTIKMRDLYRTRPEVNQVLADLKTALDRRDFEPD